jgi:hypothetical protein
MLFSSLTNENGSRTEILHHRELRWAQKIGLNSPRQYRYQARSRAKAAPDT